MQQELHDGGGGCPSRLSRAFASRAMSSRTHSVIGVSANTQGGTEDWTDDFDLALPVKQPSPSPPSPVSASLMRIAKGEGIDAPRHHSTTISSTDTAVKRSTTPSLSVRHAPSEAKSPAPNGASGSRGGGSSANTVVSSRHRHRKDPQRSGEHHHSSSRSSHQRRQEEKEKASIRKTRQDSARPRRNSRTDSARSHTPRTGSAGEETTRRRRSRDEKIPHARITTVTSGAGGQATGRGFTEDANDSFSDTEVLPVSQPHALRTSISGGVPDAVSTCDFQSR